MASEQTPTQTDPDDTNGDARLLYEVTSSHWSHAEQIRWTLLYNLLVASTILILAWAAVFAVSPKPKGARVALMALAVVGVLISIIWVFLEDRANGFVAMYGTVGREAEGRISSTRGAFLAADDHRERLHGLSAFVRTSRVVIWVPCLFLLLFVILVVLSICL